MGNDDEYLGPQPVAAEPHGVVRQARAGKVDVVRELVKAEIAEDAMAEALQSATLPGHAEVIKCLLATGSKGFTREVLENAISTCEKRAAFFRNNGQELNASKFEECQRLLRD